MGRSRSRHRGVIEDVSIIRLALLLARCRVSEVDSLPCGRLGEAKDTLGAIISPIFTAKKSMPMQSLLDDYVDGMVTLDHHIQAVLRNPLVDHSILMEELDSMGYPFKDYIKAKKMACKVKTTKPPRPAVTTYTTRIYAIDAPGSLVHATWSCGYTTYTTRTYAIYAPGSLVYATWFFLLDSCRTAWTCTCNVPHVIGTHTPRLRASVTQWTYARRWI